MSLLSLVAIAVFVSSLVVRVVRVCACARWVTLMVYFPAMALPAVVALNAVVLRAIEYRNTPNRMAYQVPGTVAATHQQTSPFPSLSR